MDAALQPPPLNTSPDHRYGRANRPFQGIPGITITPGGRLLATWYAGGKDEGPDNYVLLVWSDDGGSHWSPPVLVVDPSGTVRAYDPCLWTDPLGRVWLFWAQSDGWFDGRCGVWASVCEQPDAAAPAWSSPRRLANGIMMNKPTVLASGEWLLPAAVWSGREPQRDDVAAERYSNVIASQDQGRTWHYRGGADVPERTFDEHMVVERRDGSLWMLVRTRYGIGQSTSIDGGATWSPGEPTGLGGPDSRFFLRRLQSGRLLLVNHHNYTKRNNLTAMLSDDDGRSWYGHLLLDSRERVSYPDGVEAADGRIFIIYDRDRYGEREILLATVTEEEVAAGEMVGSTSRLQRVVDGGPD